MVWTRRWFRLGILWGAGPHLEVAEEIRSAGCARIGLMLGGNSPEYAFWAFLGAPNDALHLEWIVAGTPSERYRDRSFVPCAVICQTCGDGWPTVNGLPLSLETSGIKLYMAPP